MVSAHSCDSCGLIAYIHFIYRWIGNCNMLYKNKAFLSSQEYTEYHKQSFRKNLYYQRRERYMDTIKGDFLTCKERTPSGA
jgi:hypothetical protein